MYLELIPSEFLVDSMKLFIHAVRAQRTHSLQRAWRTCLLVACSNDTLRLHCHTVSAIRSEYGEILIIRRNF